MPALSPQKEKNLTRSPEKPLQLRPPELAVCSLTSKLDKGQCPVKHQRELQRIQHACPQPPKREAPQDRLWSIRGSFTSLSMPAPSPQKERHLKIGSGEPLELNLLEMAVCSLTSKLDKGECSVKRQRELQKT